jgi:hypothetical protein
MWYRAKSPVQPNLNWAFCCVLAGLFFTEKHSLTIPSKLKELHVLPSQLIIKRKRLNLAICHQMRALLWQPCSTQWHSFSPSKGK